MPNFQGFPYSPTKNLLIPLPEKISPLNNNKNFIFSCSHCSSTIFALISYSLYTQDMLILILIDVQYSQKAIFSFEKGLNCENYSYPGSHHPVKNLPQQNFKFPPSWGWIPPLLNRIWFWSWNMAICLYVQPAFLRICCFYFFWNIILMLILFIVRENDRIRYFGKYLLRSSIEPKSWWV